jgi:phage FluMu gp28-like protein
MSAILPSINIDSTALLSKYFVRHQSIWIQADDYLHAQGKQAFALAEKSVRIGWTYADAFKNVRKRLHHRKRDYLFVTKDWPSSLEYMQLAFKFVDLFRFTRAVVSHGEDFLRVNQLDAQGRPTSLTEEVKIGYIKFDNGSRIIAFSSNPYAMAVYGGDVGLDEFAKHPNAQLLWQTAQARVTWGYDLAVWSSHDGEDTLFNQFAQQARASFGCSSRGNEAQTRSMLTPAPVAADVRRRISEAGITPSESLPASQIENPKSKLQNSGNTNSPWNLYFRVTMPDAVELGLLDVINRTQETTFTPEQFLADCRTRAGSEEIFQQSYLCNPLGAATASIVEWSAIERCRFDYQIDRVHLEAPDILKHFGEFNSNTGEARESKIEDFLKASFSSLFSRSTRPKFRMGFDVAASGQGDLAAFYIDEAKGSELWLRALFTARTEDWHFLKTVLFYFLSHLPSVQAAGDESGLGRQICWEAASQFSSRFTKVNFTGRKHDLGFSLMNQLSVSEKRFPRNEPDIAADYFALRKVHTGTRWVFHENKNSLNPASHCDIAWAGALATLAHTERKHSVGAAVAYDNGWFDGRNFHCYKS